MSITQTPEDLAIVAWYDSQTEETLAALPGYDDGLTPRQAWQAFLASACLPPATNATGESLAAPASGGQGVGTPRHAFSFQFSDPDGSWNRTCIHDSKLYCGNNLHGASFNPERRA